MEHFKNVNIYDRQDPNNPNLGMINILNMARNKSNIGVKGSLKRFRDFIYIDDVIDAWYMLALIKIIITRFII